MTEEHLTALLSAAEAKKDDKGWVAAADGRLFLGDDNNGEIFWIAPLDLDIPR